MPQSKRQRSGSKTKRVHRGRTPQKARTRSAKQKAYRTPMATRQRVAKSRVNGSGKSGPRVANKEHIGTTIGKAAASYNKSRKR